jgi:very-short-patch-repair endonuclease
MGKNKEKKIYTNCDLLYGKKNFHKYSELNDGLVEWIDNTIISNLKKSTPYERIFSKILSDSSIDFVEQPFFMIDKHIFFLDFFIAKLNLAIEIDGKYHLNIKDYDKFRDKCFNCIGIKTIRVKNEELSNPKIKSIINNRINHYHNNKINNINNDCYIDKLTNILNSERRNSRIQICTKSFSLYYLIHNLKCNRFSSINNILEDKNIQIWSIYLGCKKLNKSKSNFIKSKSKYNYLFKKYKKYII